MSSISGSGTAVKSALDIKQLQLHWLLQITKAINYNLPSEKLFQIYLSVLKDQLHVSKLVLLVNEGTWNVAVKYGLDDEIPFTSTEDFATCVSKLSENHNTENDWMKQFETVIPVLHKDIPLAYALIGGVDSKIFHSKREVITYIHTITNLVVVAIENKRLTEESIHQAAMERELQLAAQMQSMLFPVSIVSHEMLDMAATYIPHQSVGGDYYDFIQLNTDESLVCMADVSGKGISAALLMSNFQANLHALIKHTDFTLNQIIVELNNCVNRSAQGEKFITFFIGKINHNTRTIQYINAGHNPPMVVNQQGLNILNKGTTGLGMFDNLPFLNEGEVDFLPGSLLFCYTDGITEMENKNGVVFGMDHLGSLLMRYRDVISMKILHETLVRSFDDFRQDVELNDDVTFLSLRLHRK